MVIYKGFEFKSAYELLVFLNKLTDKELDMIETLLREHDLKLIEELSK